MQSGLLVDGELCASEHSTHTGQQFIHAERLSEVIIRAQIETAYFVLVLSPCRHNDDRYSRELTYAVTDRKAIDSGHHHIKEYEIGHMRFNLLKRLLPITCLKHLIALKLKVACYQA